jgi:glucose-1-phosphate thymidylyltransferase
LIRKAIVLAAGRGTRLFPIAGATPKEMMMVGARTVVAQIVEILISCGIEDILFVLNPQKTALLECIRSWQNQGLNISYCLQDKPSGTAHAVQCGRKRLDEESFIVVYGDNYFESSISFVRAIRFHQERRADATLLLHRVEKPFYSGLVNLGEHHKILRIIEKPTAEEASSCRVGNNYLGVAGLHVLEPAVFKFIEQTKPGRNGETWLTDSIELMRANGYDVYGVLSRKRVWDIGTYEMLKEARSHCRMQRPKE